MQAFVRGALITFRRSNNNNSKTSSSSSAAATRRHFHSKRGFAYIFNSIHGSNMSRRGGSFAASLPSDSSNNPPRRHNRLPKHERRALLIAFVDKYRASNAGKYPTASAAKKQVGGSYYVVKKIIQELEYNTKSSTPTKVKERPPFPEAIEVPSSIITADLTSSEQTLELVDDSQPIVPSKKEMDVTTSNSFEVKEKTINSSETPISEEYLNPKSIDDLSNRDQVQTNLESNVPSHLFAKKPEYSKEHAAISDDIDFNNQNVVQEAFQEAFDSDDLERDISEKHKEENQLPKRSTMWGSLRSFADGIIDLWRKK